MEQVISLDGVIKAYKNSCHNVYEMSNYFEVTEKHIILVIQHYKMKFGLSTYD